MMKFVNIDNKLTTFVEKYWNDDTEYTQEEFEEETKMIIDILNKMKEQQYADTEEEF